MSQLTKFGTVSNIKIPPESTGSRVYHHVHLNVAVSGLTPLTGQLPWAFISSSGITGFVTSYGDIELSANKRLTLLVDKQANGITVSPTEVLNLSNESGAASCTVVTVEPIYSPAVMLAGGDSPDNFLNIDRAGSAYVRFTEGEQQLDPKGATRISTPTIIMDAKFLGGVNDTIAYGKTVGTASQTNSTVERILFMDVGSNTGDAIIKRTNRRAFFQGGFSTIFETAVSVGDTGKTNVVRRWGYYNDDDGLFFELDGETLSVVVRSSASGSLVETRVPQSQWNSDKLDGTGNVENLSAIDLNVSYMNYYFIDFPGSAAGRIRFGIYGPQGRIVVHQFFFGNNQPLSFMRTASLPMTWEQFNKGPSPSPSRMKTIGGSVMNEGFQTPESQISISSTYTVLQPSPVSTTGSDWKAILTARAAKFVPGSGDPLINGRVTIPQKLCYYVSGGPVALQIRAGVVLAGTPNFQQAASGSVAEVDWSGQFPTSPLQQGVPQLTRIYGPGHHTVDPPEAFNVRGSALTTRSDGEYGIAYTFVFKPLNPADNVTITVALDWIDI